MAYLTDQDKDRILAIHGDTVMKRIQVNPYFMAELVREGVMDSYESQDIQAEQTPGRKRNALLAHLQCAGVEAFINFCIVLEVKQRRNDIVNDVFGLKLRNLQYQKDHIRQGTSRSEPTAASPVVTVPNVATVQQPYYGTGQRQDNIRQGISVSGPTAASPVGGVQQPCTSQRRADVQRETSEPHGVRPGPSGYQPTDRPTYGNRQELPTGKSMDETDQSLIDLTHNPPHVPPSHINAAGSAIRQDILDLSNQIGSIEIKEYKMLHDPSQEREIHGTELNAENWMTAEFERLKGCLVAKHHKPVVIALLDSGVFTDHPDLNSIELIIENRNCVRQYDTQGMFLPNDTEEKDLTRDKANHGTMSAGIVCQCAGAENVKLLNLKVMKGDGVGSLLYVNEALNYIKEWDAQHQDMQVDIILMTLGGPQRDSETNRLLAEFGEKKILVCSASNEGQTKPNSVMSPANHGSVIAIGSCNNNGDRCSHSSVGQELDFLFPGEEVQSTSSKYRSVIRTCRYTEKSGTSFAAPYAAALMALVLSYVETHITLGRLNGTHWRKELTRSSEMKKLLRDLCCRREHSFERGFGAPELDRIRKDWIQAYLKSAYNVTD